LIAFHSGPPVDWVPRTIQLRPKPFTITGGAIAYMVAVVVARCAVKAVRVDGICRAALTRSLDAVLLAVAATGRSIAPCFGGTH
jgi:hypothetical protein